MSTLPILLDIAVTDVVDVSSGSGELTLTATATDDDLVDRVVFYFDESLSYTFGPGSNGTIGSGWDTNDTASNSYTVTDSTGNGTINIDQVWVYDSTGNVVRYDSDDLINMDLDTEFEITGGREQDTPPSLLDIAVTDVVDVSSGSGELTLTATATDDDLVDRVVFYFDESLSYTFGPGSNGTIGSGWDTNDTASNSYTVTDSTGNGTINIDQVWVYDSTGNVVRYDSDDLINMDLDTEFEITGGRDVENIANTPPSGNIQIIGSAVEGTELTADTSALSDEDGLGAFSYQWLRDGTAIDGATGQSYTLTQDDVGAEMSVAVSYTDGFGTEEEVTSAVTAAVENVNDAPQGEVTVSGNAVEDAELTADASGLSDADGLGTFSYQWLRDGTPVEGATGDSYPLGQDDVGAEMSVTVSYTDGFGTEEEVTSAATAAVENVNDAPQGEVTVSGDAVEDAELTADASGLSDADGLGAFSYQWLRDGTPVSASDDESYTLTQADVGAEMSVAVIYTDGLGARETVTSAATSSVENVNDAPRGEVIISGDASEGNELMADASGRYDANSPGLFDADGLGAFSYQWLRDGTAIDGATGESYTLTQEDVGAAMSVAVSYTDGFGTEEEVTSAATAAVENVNDAPQGTVLVTGDAVEDADLTADASGLSDEDGLGAFSYQWLRDGTPVEGATGESYTLQPVDIGAAVSVRVGYTDGEGTDEVVRSAASPVAPAAGTDGADIITGGPRDDRLEGLDGNDTLNGGDGNDALLGGVGNDVIYGDAGDDNISSSDGADAASGGDGDDRMGGGLGDDDMRGDAGDDFMGGGQGNDAVDGGADNDVVNGGAGDDTLDGGTGSDTMGGSFNNDVVNGGDGDDDMGGGAGQDTVDAGAGNDSVGGGEGNDEIAGGDGDDFLAGGGRDDVIDGGAGTDSINGGDGDDTMTGGDGEDRFVFNFFKDGDADIITDYEDGVDGFLIRTISTLDGTPNIDNGGNGLQGFLDALNINDTADGAQMNVDGHIVTIENVAATDLTLGDFAFI
ncbi:hypothetical protein [Roseovarius sp. SYSU LYC5161]|uniref:hypothetical protein n=1 Tax=Roseovarius halophilus (ex Wu et al. 2025) TaxID=3376060 RepID=UPI0039998D79